MQDYLHNLSERFRRLRLSHSWKYKTWLGTFDYGDYEGAYGWFRVNLIPREAPRDHDDVKKKIGDISRKPFLEVHVLPQDIETHFDIYDGNHLYYLFAENGDAFKIMYDTVFRRKPPTVSTLQGGDLEFLEYLLETARITHFENLGDDAREFLSAFGVPFR